MLSIRPSHPSPVPGQEEPGVGGVRVQSHERCQGWRRKWHWRKISHPPKSPAPAGTSPSITHLLRSKHISTSSCLGKPCLMLEHWAELLCIFRNPKESSTPHFLAILSTVWAKTNFAGALLWSSSEETHLFHLLLEMVLAVSPVRMAECLGDEEQRLDIPLSSR